MFVTIALSILDVVVVTFLVYKTIMIFIDSRAMQIFKGIAIILALWLISSAVGLESLKFIISQVSLYGILALIILFQPEIRNGLEKLGKRNLNYKSSMNKDSSEKMIESIIQASAKMSREKVGALICLEIEDSLKEYIETGIEMNAKVSKELLINIFAPKVPLHDGALIISNNRAEAASCFLPLSGDLSISKELGTRHRSALGLSELTDALIVIVSEETGTISIAKDKKLYRGVSTETLRNNLKEVLIQKEKPQRKQKRFFSLKGGNNKNEKEHNSKN